MNRINVVGFVAALLIFLSITSFAQIDELSDATGLPIPIGAPAIYGQITMRGLSRTDRKPLIFVHLLDRGVPLDRRQANESGYFYFLKAPREGHMLTFEVDGREVGRVMLSGGTSTRARQDVTLDWAAINGAPIRLTGVISSKNRYSRAPEAEKAFDKAMAAFKAEKTQEAISLFKVIADKDPNDFLAWTLLGSLYLAEDKLPKASAALTKALELNPEFGLALITMGRVAIAQRNFDNAIKVSSRAVELDPQSAEANHVLGEAYLQAKKGSIAVGYLNKAIEIAPIDKAEIHLRLAALYNAAGLKARAVTEYKAFLAKVKNHPDKEKIEKYIRDNSQN